jgi:hypothetical protein
MIEEIHGAIVGILAEKKSLDVAEDRLQPVETGTRVHAGEFLLDEVRDCCGAFGIYRRKHDRRWVD